jgi:hypothetical protein
MIEVGVSLWISLRCFKKATDYSAIKDDYAREQVISKDLIAYESDCYSYVRFAPIGVSLMEDLEYKNKGKQKVSELLQEV